MRGSRARSQPRRRRSPRTTASSGRWRRRSTRCVHDAARSTSRSRSDGWRSSSSRSVSPSATICRSRRSTTSRGSRPRTTRLSAEELRARLVRLGDVNPGALAELEEIRGRHEFLDAQRVDLERSLEDLRQTIGKLARTSRRRFEETFEAANEKLAEVFPKLFPGGTARLETTCRARRAASRASRSSSRPRARSSSPSACCRAVRRRSPRRRSSSRCSSSGRRRSACSTRWTRRSTRPTSAASTAWCSEMAQRSQFVLITHNRRTMEAADTLYGITMEQAGRVEGGVGQAERSGLTAVPMDAGARRGCRGGDRGGHRVVAWLLVRAPSPSGGDGQAGRRPGLWQRDGRRRRASTARAGGDAPAPRRAARRCLSARSASAGRRASTSWKRR